MTYPGISADEDPDRAAVEARRREREEEMGTYVANQDIPWGNVLAFPTGSAVPKSTVERLGWLDLGLVDKATSDKEPTSTPAGAANGEPTAVTTAVAATAEPTPTHTGAASVKAPKSGGNS